MSKSYQSLSSRDREMLKLLVKKYVAHGYEAEIRLAGNEWDDVTLWYRIRSRSGVLHNIRLQKFQGSIFKARWLIQIARLVSEETDEWKAGYSIRNGLANALSHAEELMAGSPAEYLDFEEAMSAAGGN